MQENNIDTNDTYDFSITGLLKEAFARTDGVKGYFAGAMIIYVVIAFITNSLLEVVFPQEGSTINTLVSSLLSMPVTLPILIGITFLGIKQARNQEIQITSIFDYFSFLLPIILAYLATTALIAFGFVLLIIPGVYLAISYTFVYPLVVEKGLGTWEAMELSRKTITKQWFKFFGLALTTGVILVLSVIPLGVGLIWSVPMIYISYGLLYSHIFDA